MRIIGGKFRSRTFNPGKNFKARPTTDFARENLFNILSNRFDFEDLKVLDLFGGTGSISFEFASRGCEDITCVEQNRMHYLFIHSVIDKLDLKKEVNVIHEDVFRFLQKTDKEFDLIFADPPYDLKRLSELPDLIVDSEILKGEGILILEHGKKNDFSSHPDFSEIRTYGSVHFSFFHHKSELNLSKEEKQ
jgi:16S rRNA (guanine(966)-N(2))-methyltransferase RsmD